MPRAVASACGGLALVLGLLVIVGWHTHETRLVQVVASTPPMQYSTALGVVLCGAGLLLAALAATRAAAFCGAVAAATGILGLVGYGIGIQPGIDDLVMDHLIRTGAPPVGTTGPVAALCLAVSGSALVGLVLLQRDEFQLLLVAAPGALVASVGGIAIYRILSGVELAPADNAFTQMAGQAAAGFALVGSGLVASAGVVSEGRRRQALEKLALALGGGILVIGVIVWGARTREDRRQIEVDVSHQAALIQDAFARSLRPRAFALALMAELWEAHDSISREAWVLEAERVREEQGFATIALMGTRFRDPWVTPSEAAATLTHWLAQLEGAAAAVPGPDREAPSIAVHLVDLGSGRERLVLQRPLKAGAGITATLVGAMPFRDLLDQAFHSLPSHGGPVLLLKGGKVLYRHGEGARTEARRPYEREIELAGISWSLRLWSDVAERKGLFAEASLVLGLVSALLVTIAAQLGLNARRRAAELAAANVRLESEIELRQRGAEALRGSEEWYRGAINTTIDAVLTINARGIIQLVNPAAEKLFGYKGEELLGQNVSMLMTSPYREQHDDFLARYLRTGERKVIGIGREVVGQRKDDSTFIAYLSVGEFEARGERLFTGFLRDITQSKQNEQALRASEERFRRMVEEAPLPIMLHMEGGAVLLVNQMWSDLTGYSHGEIPTIASWVERAFGNAAEEIRSRIERLYHAVDRVSDEKLSVITKGGEQRLWEFSSTPLGELPDGRKLVMTMAVDVTDRDLARELARSNKDLEQFAYVASHDLQEPLRMVASYVQLLGKRYKGQLDGDADKYIHYAVDGARRMQALITDLLSYSRAGRGEISKEPVSCSDLLAEVVANLRATIQETGARVTADQLPDVWGNRSQLLQVFQNLIENAIKYRGEAPPRIHVGLERRGDELLFFVRDNGIGFKPEHGERIFRPFQRLHELGRYPGTGIGLAIVHRIVSSYRGTIWAESRPGEGSTFYFTLPIAEQERNI